ncbi:MAG: FAD-dependent oxidoreductase [Dehalococcoidia bacterium]
MSGMSRPERVETVIVGGGQAGLATAYHLQRRKRACVVLDAAPRVGDPWRERWDSLRLFTPAGLSSLPGMRYPGAYWSFPSKDEFADYLEGYAAHFAFDVRHDARVDAITKREDRYLVTAGPHRFDADHVVLATGTFQEPKLPAYAPELNVGIVQLHSSAYRNPGQLREGPVLVVGAANSGAELALELSATRDVWLAGHNVKVFPVRPGSLPSRLFMPPMFFAATHMITTKTPVGRRVRRHIVRHGAPLMRVKPGDLVAAGVRRVGPVAGVRDGRPVLEDGTVLDAANVIWCTGFRPDFAWIDHPAFASGEEPDQERGVLTAAPGIYRVGQLFQHALSSSFIGGIGHDAAHVASAIARRARDRQRASERRRREVASETRNV